MELATGMMMVGLFFTMMIVLIGLLGWITEGGLRNYGHWYDFYWLQNRIYNLERDNDLLRRQSQPSQPSRTEQAPPPPQIIEHRHVHVLVNGSSMGVQQPLLIPAKVQAKAHEVGGEVIEVNGQWKIIDPDSHKVLFETKPKPKMLTAK